MTNPTIIFACKGMAHLIYGIWCIRSLQRFDYQPIEIMVGNEEEQAFFTQHCPGVVCNIVSVDAAGYPVFSYKPFALTKYLKDIGIQHTGRDVVICDTDILWKQDPAALFRRFAGKNWVHKITAVNPEDYDINPRSVRPAYISLRTIQNYERRYPINRYPDFVVNAGLFMLPEKVFPEMLGCWMDKILSLPGDEMLMSEALMALTYAEMGLAPISDRENIKHFGRQNQGQTERPVLSFEVAPDLSEQEFTGYQTAKHYFGDQRPKLFEDANSMGLDPENLAAIASKELKQKKLQRWKNVPSRLASVITGKR